MYIYIEGVDINNKDVNVKSVEVCYSQTVIS